MRNISTSSCSNELTLVQRSQAREYPSRRDRSHRPLRFRSFEARLAVRRSHDHLLRYHRVCVVSPCACATGSLRDSHRPRTRSPPRRCRLLEARRLLVARRLALRDVLRLVALLRRGHPADVQGALALVRLPSARIKQAHRTSVLARSSSQRVSSARAASCSLRRWVAFAHTCR